MVGGLKDHYLREPHRKIVHCFRIKIVKQYVKMNPI